MVRLSAARSIVLSYALCGLCLGIGFSVCALGDKLGWYYRHPDGSVTKSRTSLEATTDPGTGKVVYVSVATGRPLTKAEKFWVGTWESMPLLIAATLVGAFWGLTHQAIRTAVTPVAEHQNRLDYDDSISRTCPPGST
jgi:hypothetical protein